MNDDVNSRNLKRDNIYRELKSLLSSSKFEEILKEKIEWLLSLGVKIIPVATRAAVEIECIDYGAKVSWEKGSVPKKAISLMLNTLDFRDMKFIAILLHECGHIRDKDDSSIVLETTESEISAWNHAIYDIRKMSLEDSERKVFNEVMKIALLSYKVEEQVILKMIENI